MDVRRSDSGEIGKSEGDKVSAAKKKTPNLSRERTGGGVGWALGGLMACSLSRWRSKEGGLYQLGYLAGLEEVEIVDRI